MGARIVASLAVLEQGEIQLALLVATVIVTVRYLAANDEYLVHL